MVYFEAIKNADGGVDIVSAPDPAREGADEPVKPATVDEANSGAGDAANESEAGDQETGDEFESDEDFEDEDEDDLEDEAGEETSQDDSEGEGEGEEDGEAEDEAPSLKCTECDFEAGSPQGLGSHKRAKHPGAA